MPLDDQALKHAFDFDADVVTTLRRDWSKLVESAVWNDLKSRQIGALPRMRKRIFEIGEMLRSLVADRAWIPQPRERVKGAMAAALNLRDALQQADRAVATLTGGDDFASFERSYLDFRQRLLVFLESHENRFGDLLESLYDQSIDDDVENLDDQGTHQKDPHESAGRHTQRSIESGKNPDKIAQNGPEN